MADACGDRGGGAGYYPVAENEFVDGASRRSGSPGRARMGQAC